MEKKKKNSNINQNKKQDNKKQDNKKNSSKFKKSKTTNKKKHAKLKLFLRIMLILFVILFIVGAAIFAGIFFSDKWAVTKDDLVLSKINTTIYDKDENVIATVSGDEKRKIIALENIPEDLKDAFIAIEDETFYKHHGINLKRTIGATVTYILHRGNANFGGSTITQQLIKNLLNDKDNSGVAGIQRKIREMSRAYQVENLLSKDQILELYLNIIFMGGDVYGVELGSEYYFNKPVQELDLAECAFLAGINNSPNMYNPFEEGNDRTEKINNRTKIVLSKMKELGKINEEEYNNAINKINEGFHFEKGNTSSANTMSYLARAALNQVIDQYAEEKGVSKESATLMISGGGYKIYSTQDSNIQTIMEEVYKDDDYIIHSNGVQVQSAMAIMDHKTGRVVGIMGGLGEGVNSVGLNRATQSKRQPGSSIKPIASIAPGLEKGIIKASTIYDDSPTSFGNYRPRNSGGYLGLTTVRKAIEVSSNVAEVKIMSELGPANSIEFLKTKMGITSLVTAKEDPEKNDENLSMVLGGITHGITPLEMTGAYAAIANDGLYITPTMYTKMEDSSGKVVLEPKQERIRAMSEENAYIEKSILTGPVAGGSGTARNCSISGFDVGAKTGTTDDNTDRWLCGFTNYYTAGTWYGYDDPQIKIRYSGYNPASRIWIAIMRKIHSGLEGSRFEQPEGVTTASICMDSGKLATDSCTRVYTEYFVKGTIPDECDGHEKVKICTDTGLRATEFCPHTEERTGIKKPEKEDTTMWKTDEGDKYSIPSDYCSEHTAPAIKTVEMPNVIGMNVETARKKLEDLGLKVTVETKTSKEPDGKVLSQSKSAGTQLNEGESVRIVVSKKENEETNEENTTTPPQNEETGSE